MSGLRTELRDWARYLHTPELSASFSLPSSVSSMQIFSDASYEGCGIVVDGSATFWSLPGRDGMKDVDIGVMETWALHLALQAVIALGLHDCVATFHVDNMGVVYAARKGRSRSKLTNICLNDIAERALGANIVMSIIYVASADNLADAPSRGNTSGYTSLSLDLAVPWNEVLRTAAPR
ncbi:hypothetical protein A4X13_0g8128 [Tilletia indica]|uniref:RNase H type-1 domain-containing protein n=1 Tax=Tilletia indica TaxID=43049 RepID=A0A177T1X3_9BASI|nr:hypothetical protein A4X13_0g8128 [Tilletia indica]